MGLEDAAVLSALLPPHTTPISLPSLIPTYESLRRPRCEKVLNLARAFGNAWSAKDPERIAQRNEYWRSAFEKRDLPVRADGDAPPGSAMFGEWLEGYDVFDEVEKVRRMEVKAKL